MSADRKPSTIGAPAPAPASPAAEHAEVRDALATADTELVLVLEDSTSSAPASAPPALPGVAARPSVSTSNPRFATPEDQLRFAKNEDRFADGALVLPPYTGPHAFWLRDAQGALHGPYGYDALVPLLRAEANRTLWSAEISPDGRTFTPLATFAALTGQEGLLHDDKERVRIKPADVVGYLDERSLLSVLARAGADRLTGVLTVLPEGLRRHVHRAVHLRDGVPTWVYANDDALQLPEVLVAKKLVARAALPELVHTALGAGRPLDDLVAERAQTGKSRALVMKERMADMLRWRLGRFVFDPEAKVEVGPPLARSMALLLPELVHRGLSIDDLRALLMPALGGLLDAKLEAARGLDAAMAELGLTAAQKDAAQRIAKARRLSAQLAARPAEEKLLLGVAYLLVELGLLVRA